MGVGEPPGVCHLWAPAQGELIPGTTPCPPMPTKGFLGMEFEGGKE